FYTTSLLSRYHFFLHTPTPTYIYTLSLHDALPISTGWRPQDILGQKHDPLPARQRLFADRRPGDRVVRAEFDRLRRPAGLDGVEDRKSTRLNSSHLVISYAVFCLKKKITKV